MSAERAAAALLLLLPALAAGPARAGDVGSTAVFPAGSRLSFQAAPHPGGVVFETGDSAPIPDAWDTVLFQGENPDAGLSFEAARKLPGGRWTAWQPAHVKRFPNGRFWGRSVFSAKAPGAVRLRAVDAGVAGAHEVKIFSVETFVAADHERRASVSEAAGAEEVPRPLVHGREEWHALPPKEPYTPHAPYRITLHHSDTKQTRDLADTLQEVRFIQDFHMNGRGWNDIAYHFIIDAAGHVVEGRPEGVVGAHVENQNTGNIGIVMLGTYHPPKNDPVTPEQLQAFVDVASYIAAKYGVDPATLKGHREYKSTDCPGDELFALLPQLRARVEAAAKAKPAVAAAPKVFKPLPLRAPDFAR